MEIAAGGYVWWYLDGISNDGRAAITLIAFIGSVFSPYYAWAGRRDPLNHCAINIALYTERGGRWAMTERGRAHVERGEHALTIGPSSLVWRGDSLELNIDEIAAPLPRRIRGKIRLTPTGLTERAFPLDTEGRHVWQPVAPRARLDVKFDDPNMSWSGTGYFDSNYGREPLEAGFQNWSWSRLHRRDDSLVLYDTHGRDGSQSTLALRFERDGRLKEMPQLPPAAMPKTGWRMARPSRADLNHPISVRRTLEDTPFYSRSLIEGSFYGEHAVGIHESLCLDRFASPLVKAALPFRMPRGIFR